MKIRIYQINMGRDKKRVCFQSYDALNQFQGTDQINNSIYDCVFSGDVDCNGLEDVFQKFNTDHPIGYTGKSLSVSDIVEVIEADNIKQGFYFCDSVGFKEISFDSEKAEPYKENKIKVLMVEPGKKAYEAEIGTDLHDLYAALDCDCIQTFYPYEDLVVIVCDDEGKLNGSRANRAIYSEDGKMMDIIFGKFFICDCSTSEFKSLPDDMIEKYKNQFLLPERFCRINDEILAVKFDPAREEAR